MTTTVTTPGMDNDTPDVAQTNIPEPNPNAREPKQGFWGKYFFPLGAVALTIWGVIIAMGDAVPKPEFDPTEEFDLSDPVIGGHLEFGAIDLAINKGVVYLFIAFGLSCLFALYVNRTVVRRLKQETKTQSVVEGVYEFCHDMIAGSLGKRAFSRYMPFVAALFMFIWFVNMTSFVPLPLNTHAKIGGLDFLYGFGIYATSSNIFFTITLALVTFLIYHYEGIRAHGFFGYLGTWKAGQTGLIAIPVFIVEMLTNLLLKPMSLGVRLFANMLSGHILILLMLALSGIIGGAVIVSGIVQVFGIGVALVFYLFEFVLVATLQAFIFAILTAIYIGQATEEHH